MRQIWFSRRFVGQVRRQHSSRQSVWRLCSSHGMRSALHSSGVGSTQSPSQSLSTTVKSLRTSRHWATSCAAHEESDGGAIQWIILVDAIWQPSSVAGHCLFLSLSLTWITDCIVPDCAFWWMVEWFNLIMFNSFFADFFSDPFFRWVDLLIYIHTFVFSYLTQFINCTEIINDIGPWFCCCCCCCVTLQRGRRSILFFIFIGNKA